MLNYHDTKKGSLFWISKIKWYVIQHQRQRTKMRMSVIFKETQGSTLSSFRVLQQNNMEGVA